MMRRERIAVTGVGIVSALGPDAPTSFRQLWEGARGFAPVTLFDVSGQRARLAAEVRGLNVADVAPAAEAEAWSRTDALGLLAAAEAVRSARLDPVLVPLALAVGGTTGGMYEAEGILADMARSGALDASALDASAKRLLSYPLSTTADRIAARLGPVQRASTICSACSSSAVALVQGASWLLQGRAQAVLAGGSDGLCRLTFTGFNALGAMDPTPCRPFDSTRAGLSLGEGAAFLMLELEASARKRGARVLAWLTGFAVSAEAHHITHPEPSGAIAARTIERALARAQRSPSDVDYVNAHGTGTVHNDNMEARALARAFGAETPRVWVSSCKGQVGHTLGAAGAIEAALTVLSLESGQIAATGGLEKADPTLGLRHVPKGARAPLRCAISNSFGFGGTGCVLVFEHESNESNATQPVTSDVVITGLATAGAHGVLRGAANARYASTLPAASSGEDPTIDARELLDSERSRRFDVESAWVTACARAALEDAGAAAADTGLVAGTAYGNVERSVAFLERVNERGPRFASPAEFPHLVPSAASGNASIYLGLTGPVASTSDLTTSAEAAFELAFDFVAAGLTERVVAGAAEPSDPIVTRVLAPLHSGESTFARGEGAGFVMLESASAARARAARVYARVRSWSAERRAWMPIFESLPAGAASAKCKVILAATEPALVSALERSRFRAAPRVYVARHVGEHEALGGIALAAGAAALHEESLDSVLVCGAAHGRCYVALLEPAADAGASLERPHDAGPP